jgi:hypothetical protein
MNFKAYGFAQEIGMMPSLNQGWRRCFEKRGDKPNAGLIS